MSNGMGSRDPADWDRAIDILNRSGGRTHVPLLEAVRSGAIELGYIKDRNAEFPFGKIRRATKPVLILVADDDDTPTGPDGWRIARQVTAWAAGAIVHGAGAERQHYEMAVDGALVCQRFLLVETTSAFVAPWLSLLGHCQTLVIVPRGGVHPIAEDRVQH